MRIQKNPTNPNNNHQLLTYYKCKVEDLEKERQAWLAKLDECKSRMINKQAKQDQLRQLKAKHADTQFSIIHHTIAKFDEQISALAVDRDNQNLELEEAECLIKLRELSQEQKAAPESLQSDIAGQR